MTEPKFIPGPYAVDQVVSDELDITLGYGIPWEGDPILIGTVLVGGKDRPFTREQILATAKLWAGSPNLFTACCAALAVWERKVTVNGEEQDAIAILRAAIKSID